MIKLRDDKRYGIFKVNSNMGIVILHIEKYGWGELLSVYKNGKEIASVDTELNNTSQMFYTQYEEDDKHIEIDQVIIQKPFIRCLKRF